MALIQRDHFPVDQVANRFKVVGRFDQIDCHATNIGRLSWPQQLLEKTHNRGMELIDTLFSPLQFFDLIPRVGQDRWHGSIEKIADPFTKKHHLPTRGLKGNRRQFKEHRIQLRRNIHALLLLGPLTHHANDERSQQIGERQQDQYRGQVHDHVHIGDLARNLVGQLVSERQAVCTR